jgi:hypothetical protein
MHALSVTTPRVHPPTPHCLNPFGSVAPIYTIRFARVTYFRSPFSLVSHGALALTSHRVSNHGEKNV